MTHRGLQLRMAIVGTILFGFYLGLASFAYYAFGLGLGVILLGSLAVVGFQYVLGKKVALWSVGAEDMSEEEFPEIHRSVEALSGELGIEKPRLMVAGMGVPNAFATGRRAAGVVVVSRELIATVDHDELEGVLAHELAHIDNRDVLTMTLGQSVAMLLGYAAYFTVLVAGEDSIASIALAWVAAMVTQLVVMVFVMAISRYREYVADADAADVLGTGEPLARALEKIDAVGQRTEAEVDDSVAALCIDGGARQLLSTHPPMEERVDRLRAQ